MCSCTDLWEPRRATAGATRPPCGRFTLEQGYPALSKKPKPPPSGVPVFKPWKPAQPARIQPFKPASFSRRFMISSGR